MVLIKFIFKFYERHEIKPLDFYGESEFRLGKLKLQAKFSRKEKSRFFHFGGSRKTPYRKPLATALDLFRKCGQRNATFEITRLAGDIGGGSSADKRVVARDAFPGMKLRISSPA